MKRPVIIFLSLLLLMLGLTLTAAADTIDFNNVPGHPSTVTNGYGNTANVTVSYQTVNATGGVETANLALWNPYIFNYYGDLGVVGYVTGGDGQPDAGGYYGEIILTPAAGYSVTLQSFDVAPFVGTAPGDQLFAILDQNGNPLIEYTNQTISTSTHITYSPNVTYNGPLTLEFGPSGNIGLNYINFTSQTSTVPIPASVWLLGFGLLRLIGYRKKRLV